MNAFALLLLAFPFYLATKGRLVTYIQLASTQSSAAATTGSGSASSESLQVPSVTTEQPVTSV